MRGQPGQPTEKLSTRQLDKVLRLKQSDRHAVIINERKMLSGEQKSCSFQDKDSCPVIWHPDKDLWYCQHKSIERLFPLLGGLLDVDERPTMQQTRANVLPILAFDYQP